MLGPMGERGFNSKICCQASVQVRRFRASGIRSGKPEGFMNSNPTRLKLKCGGGVKVVVLEAERRV